MNPIGLHLHKLSRLTDEQKVRTLAQAANFFMKMPFMAMDMAPSAVTANPNVRLVSGQKTAPPSVDSIKSFLVAQKYATPDDNDELTDVSNQFEQFFHTNMPEIDVGWAQLFGLVDLRQSTHDHFDILDTNAGLSWNQTAPGEKVKIRRAITEAKATVGVLTFSDGLGLLDDWLRFNQFWNVQEALMEFRNTAFDKMAQIHYGLLTALGAGVDVAFDTDDATTFNNAGSSLLRAVRGKGYAAGQNAQFDIACAPEHVGRILKMLTATRGSAIVDHGTVDQPIAYSVRSVVSTTHIPANSTGYYLVLPGRKIKRGLWKDLTVEDARNAYVRATDLVGTMQFNAAIGDVAQVRRVKFA